jgi:hypothetical protein
VCSCQQSVIVRYSETLERPCSCCRVLQSLWGLVGLCCSVCACIMWLLFQHSHDFCIGSITPALCCAALCPVVAGLLTDGMCTAGQALVGRACHYAVHPRCGLRPGRGASELQLDLCMPMYSGRCCNHPYWHTMIANLPAWHCQPGRVVAKVHGCIAQLQQVAITFQANKKWIPTCKLCQLAG